MVKTPTVLVLGAGASQPFGFPTGTELYASACEFLSDPKSRVSQALVRAEIDQDVLDYFAEALRHFGGRSVDQLIQDQPDFDVVGRATIAAILARRELDGPLFTVAGAHWYKDLFDRLRPDPGYPFEAIADNRLSVVTFNYDRSLEHFLFTVIKTSLGHGRDAEAASLARSIPIVHVYGSLGEYPFDRPDDGVPYGPLNLPLNLPRIAAGIQLLDPTRKGRLDEAHDLLREAKRVAFLGFGFDPLNLDRIRSAWDGESGLPVCYATTVGWGRMLRKRIGAAFGTNLRFPVNSTDMEVFDIPRLLADAPVL